MLTPEEVAGALSSRAAGFSEELLVVWLQVLDGRAAFAERMVAHCGNLALVPLILRRDGFDNPNALLSDLTELIDENRDSFEALVERTGEIRSPMVVAILSRSEFALPQVASPMMLPSWFPVGGGRTVNVLIEDICRIAVGSLSADRVHVAELCELIHELEGVMLKRLINVARLDHNAGNALLEAIRGGESSLNYQTFLENAMNELSGVAMPHAYRPSARAGKTLAGRLLRIVSASSPDQLERQAKALERALGLDDRTAPRIRESIPAVLLRSINSDRTAGRRTCRNLLVTWYAATQLVTAAAHADEYPAYPLVLLGSVSLDLRLALAEAIAALR